MLQKLATLCSAAGLLMTVACAQTDAGITTAVKTKLAADDTVKAYQINVDTANGVVTLTGVVEMPAAKEQAVVLARGTDGVTDVVDRITVNAATASTPENLGDRVGDATRDTTRTAGERVGDGVDATKDAVGKGVDATKEFGRDAADKTEDAAQRTGEVVTDAAITSAVKSKLLVDTKTPGMRIDVDTRDGVVTLSGTVKSQAEIDKSVADARGTKGVKRVVNNLKVGA
jgi:hyperosmotically inducible protein